MADFEKDEINELDEDLVVVMTDEEGNEYYYREELIIPVGEKRFAILVPIEVDEEEEGCGCASTACDCGDETDVYIARIDTDESGEEVYVDPTDEEFDQVLKAYDELMSDEEFEA